MKPKSNKIKKAKLRQKAEEKALLLREVECRKRNVKVFIIPQKLRKLRTVVEGIFGLDDGKSVPIDNSNSRPLHGSLIGRIWEKIHGNLGHEEKEFVKQLLLRFIDEDINLESTKPNVLDAAFNLAKFYQKAIRPLSDWTIKSYNTERQISSLMRHLYAKYFVPIFMDKVWYVNNAIYQSWFIHIGQGENIRTVQGLPVPLTKKQAHFFMQAPRDFEIYSAIRYGQIIDLGGNEHFARQVLRTRIGQDFTNDHFWLGVFRWFLQNPMLDTNQYAPIIDFIYNEKFVPSKLDEYGAMVASQPNFCIKDRNPETLLRQVENWHKRLGKERSGSKVWPASGFVGLIHEVGKDKNKVVYVIRELCTQADLIKEGRTMHHCAASYSYSCSQGKTSIWTLEATSVEGTKKILTVEVNNSTRNIIQARGKYNEKASFSDLDILRRWCRSAGLTLSRWLI